MTLGPASEKNIRKAAAPETARPRVCVVGCGRSYRRDDQAGILIAADITRHVVERGITVLATEAPGTDLLAYCEGAELLVVIDAAEAGSDISPGTWMRMDYPADRHRLHARIRTNTHTLGVPEALELAENLGILPDKTWVYAVAGASFGYGPEPSRDVEEAVPRIAAAIHADIRDWIRSRPDGELAPAPPAP